MVCRLLILLAACTGGHCRTVVFSSGDVAHPDTPCFRIPSAVAIPGTNIVLAFAECRAWTGDGCLIKGRNASSGAQYFNRTICARRSVDGGASWAPTSKVLPPGTYAANPSAAWHPARRSVLLAFDGTRDGLVYTTTSRDLGRTFSAPAPAVFVNHSTNQTAVAAFAGPGNSLVVHPSGDWIAFAAYAHWRNYTTPAPTFWANVYLSLDGGATWAQDGPTFWHLGEPSLALLADGTLVLDARCADGRAPYGGPAAPCDCNCRGIAFRSAAGAWSATTYDPALPDPDVEGAILGLADGRLVFTNPSSAVHRANMTLRVGRRDGEGNGIAWERALPVGSGGPAVPAGYSSVFEGDDGRVGVLWETQADGPPVTNCTGGYCQIVLTMMTL